MTQANSKDTVEVRKSYYPSGALSWETPFVDGVQHGIERRYDKDKTNIYCLTLYDKDHEVTSIKI
jgi:antitoxin component YwqK of YwqJK toxin-antitoxin module